jgi:hypothetical protein
MCSVMEDASIHNEGFYLAGNKLEAGSNVIIYGTGMAISLLAACDCGGIGAELGAWKGLSS